MESVSHSSLSAEACPSWEASLCGILHFSARRATGRRVKQCGAACCGTERWVVGCCMALFSFMHFEIKKKKTNPNKSRKALLMRMSNVVTGRKHNSRNLLHTAGNAECGKSQLLPKLRSNFEVAKHFNILKDSPSLLLFFLNCPCSIYYDNISRLIEPGLKFSSSCWSTTQSFWHLNYR